MEKKDLSSQELKRVLETIAAEIGSMDLPAPADAVEKFCRFTDHDYAFYRERKSIPQGYIMTISVPLFNKFFIMLGSKLPPGTFKGVIHTTSVVEYFANISTETAHRARVEIGAVELKSGRKGEYFSADMDFILTDAGGAKIVSDLHKFFLKK